MSAIPPLSEDKPTSGERIATAAFDPEPTSPGLPVQTTGRLLRPNISGDHGSEQLTVFTVES